MDRHLSIAAGALAALLSLSCSAVAQLAVSANEGKVANVDGVSTVLQNPPPDHIMLIDLGASPPKVVAELDVPTSVVGPATSVAVAPDESYALVTSATKIDPAIRRRWCPTISFR